MGPPALRVPPAVTRLTVDRRLKFQNSRKITSFFDILVQYRIIMVSFFSPMFHPLVLDQIFLKGIKKTRTEMCGLSTTENLDSGIP